MKKLNYIDAVTLEHVTVDCTLLSKEKLQDFYESLTIEGQIGKKQGISKEYFVNIFKEIVKEENDAIDTGALLSCIRSRCNPKNNQINFSSQEAMLSAQFFDLFEYSNEVRIPCDQYELYAYSCMVHGSFGTNTLRELTKEKERYQNNGAFFAAIQYTPGEKVKVKEKIIPFEVNKRRVCIQEA